MDNCQLLIVNSQLPKDWEEKTLGEVLQKTKTVNPKLNPNNEFIYLDVSSVNKETKLIEKTTILLGKDAPSRAKKLVETDDIIFATVRPTHCRVAIITEEYNNQVCSTGYYVLKAKEYLNNHFVFYFLLTYGFNKNMESMQKGASYPAVTNKEVESVLIPYPKSIKEQKRIVSILDKVFSLIERSRNNAEQNLKNAKELFESYLQGVFENKGDDWVEKEWNELIEIRSGRNQKEVLNPNGKYPILGSAGKIMGYANDFLCEEGTTIIGRKGTIDKPLFIKTKFWNVDTAFGLIAGDTINQEFLFYFCKSFDFKELDKGTTLPSLVKKDLIKIVMSYPNTIQEQKQIVQKLDKLQTETKKLEAVYQQKIDDLEELKKSVLQKAFLGQLTIEN